MVEFRRGDIFAADVEALVNTVNCVGVMGRGIALQFKQEFPDNFKAYAAAKAPKLFVTFRNAKHQNLYVGAGDPSVSAPAVTPYPYNPPTPASAVGPIAAYFAITTAFWDRYLKNDSTAIARLRTAVADPDSTTTLQDDLGTPG